MLLLSIWLRSHLTSRGQEDGQLWYISTTASSRSSKTGAKAAHVVEPKACCLLLHQDNASSRPVVDTLDFLVENSVSLVTHRPYSAGLAPCQWFLFLFIKERLRGIRFQSPEDAYFAIPQSMWSGVIDRWFVGMTKCSKAEEGFIKKLG